MGYRTTATAFIYKSDVSITWSEFKYLFSNLNENCGKQEKKEIEETVK